VGGVPILARPAGIWQRLYRWWSRNPSLGLLLILFLLGIAGVIAYILW
jgi:hypothetical protein